MKKIAFFDAKPYDRLWFDKWNQTTGQSSDTADKRRFRIKYLENKLTADTVELAQGYDAVVAFVNDTLDREVIDALYQMGIQVIGMRCTGYNNIDLKAAQGKVTILRVPNYSPYAVAEHAMALLLAINRKVHRAYIRTRDYNFSLTGLTGFDLNGKTVGVIGTGQIGQIFVKICKGFGMKVLAYDPYPAEGLDVEYTDLDRLFQESRIISLHCPLTDKNRHLINEESLQKMQEGTILINTSRGALVDSRALLKALQEKHIGGAGLDVYEEETSIFFEDYSNEIVTDEVLSLLIALPNVIMTSHQAYLTQEALSCIAQTTLDNLSSFFDRKELKNEIHYAMLR